VDKLAFHKHEALRQAYDDHPLYFDPFPAVYKIIKLGVGDPNRAAVASGSRPNPGGSDGS